jgi:diguanylate cyclase (GGDEF)-like protein
MLSNATDEPDRLMSLTSYGTLDTPCDEAFDGLARMTALLTRTPISLVSLVDSERVWFKARHGLDIVQMDRRDAFCSHAIETPDRMLVIEDTHENARYIDNPVVTGNPRIRFYAGQPLVGRQGFALGSLCILDHQPRKMSDADRDVLRCVGRAVLDTLELRRAALTDLLTELSNRRHFMMALETATERSLRDGEPFGLLAIDTDNFKAINDRDGHDAGDRVLKDIARTMMGFVRRSDVVARVGGDEFAVLLTGTLPDVAQVGERLRDAVERRVGSPGRGTTLSVGAATFRSPPSSMADALKITDRLVYKAKLLGKNRVCHVVHG